MLSEEQIHFIQRSLSISKYDLQPLEKDASVRQYIRILSKDKNKTWMLMRWETFKEKDFPFIGIQAFFKKISIPVPGILAFDAEKGLFLLEDLGDVTLENFSKNHSKKDLEPWYKKAIHHLIQIQFAQEPPPKAITSTNPCFSAELLFAEMKESLNNLEMPEEKEKKIQDLFFSICLELSKEAKQNCHRDYHSRNLMIHNEKIYVIDFQDARLGPVQYDLVSLLEDVYIHFDENLKQEFIHYYWELYSKKQSQSKDFKSFFRIYQLQLLQRLFKVCATFSRFHVLKKDKRYIKYIPIATKNILKALDNFPDYDILGEVAIQIQTKYTKK